MNTNGDRLDEAIELVSARMTAVEADAGLAGRIVSLLPERSAWLPQVWIARLAVGALAALTVAVALRQFYDGSTDVLRTEGANVPPALVEPPSNNRRTIVEPRLIVRRTTVEPSLNDRRTTSEGDHEFSLAAIAAPEGLAMSPLSPVDLPAEETLTIAPLEIADLPLSSDFPQR